MLPKAKELDIDFEALGERMPARKNELAKGGLPRDAEHAMVAKMAAKAAPAPRKAPKKTNGRQTATRGSARAGR